MTEAYGLLILRTGISEHANETRHYTLWDKVKFTDQLQLTDPWRGEEVIHIKFHTSNINQGNGIEIPTAWMPLIKQSNSH